MSCILISSYSLSVASSLNSSLTNTLSRLITLIIAIISFLLPKKYKIIKDIGGFSAFYLTYVTLILEWGDSSYPEHAFIMSSFIAVVQFLYLLNLSKMLLRILCLVSGFVLQIIFINKQSDILWTRILGLLIYPSILAGLVVLLPKQMTQSEKPQKKRETKPENLLLTL